MIDKIRGKSYSDYLFFLKKKFSWIILRKFYGDFGKNSIFQKPLILFNRKSIFIGSNVTIRPGIRVEPIKQFGTQKFNPKIIIGDGTTIEQNCHIVCANTVEIGKSVTIAGYSLVTDNEHEYKDITKGVLQQSLIVRATKIGDQTFIGMGARIMSGVKIGKHCIVGSNSVVTMDLPDYSVAVGIPAKIIKRYDSETKMWRKTNTKGEFNTNE